MSEQTLPLWITVWTAPRQTIRQVIATTEPGIAYLLAGFAGVADIVTKDNDAFPQTAPSLLIAVVAGFLTGLLVVFLGGYLLRWTGRWLGGTGELREIRMAYGWSSIPKIVAGALMICAWFVLGPDFYINPDSVANMAIIVAVTILSIWSVVLHVHCLGEVQGFSAWRGLGNSILAMLVIVIPMAIIVIVVTVGLSTRG